MFPVFMKDGEPHVVTRDWPWQRERTVPARAHLERMAAAGEGMIAASVLALLIAALTAIPLGHADVWVVWAAPAMTLYAGIMLRFVAIPVLRRRIRRWFGMQAA